MIVLNRKPVETASARGPVAEVDGEPITAREFERSIGAERAAVVDYFVRTYGAKVDGTFWSRSIGGEIPAEMVKSRALEEAVRIKVQLIVAKENGLIPEASYDYLLSEMAATNGQRLQVARAGRPVYGPLQLNENAFIEYFMSRLRIRLEEKLAERELAVSDERLPAYYESVKDRLFMPEDSVAFRKISVSYAGTTRQHALEALAAVKSKLEQGVDWGEAVRVMKESDPSLEIAYSEEKLTSETGRDYAKRQPALYAVLQSEPPVGRIGEPFEEPMSTSYVLIEITERTRGEAKSFEEVRDAVRSRFLDEAYTAYLDKRVEEASVKINESAYRSFPVE